jgi:protein SMG6
MPRKILMISQGLMVSPKHKMSSDGLCLLVDVRRHYLRIGFYVVWNGSGGVFERGFSKSREEKKAELEVLEMIEVKALTDGTIEDDDGDDAPKSSSLSGSGSELVSRWVRIIRCGVNIQVAGAVDGFNWVEGSREWNVEGKLAEKMTQWKEEDQAEREEEERRRMGRRWTEDRSMDVDDAEDDDNSE